MIFIFTLVKADIYEPSQEVPAPQQAPLHPGLIPRALLVSNQPSGVYSNAGLRVPTQPDNVPDVITYLTKN